MKRRRQKSQGSVITDHNFYCAKCGQRNYSVARVAGKERENGHLKKLWCYNCKEEVNCCEIFPFSEKYTKEMFDLEFQYGNFDEEQNRILPTRQFIAKLRSEGVDVND